MLGVCDVILFVVCCDCGVMFGYCLVVLLVFLCFLLLLMVFIWVCLFD